MRAVAICRSIVIENRVLLCQRLIYTLFKWIALCGTSIHTSLFLSSSLYLYFLFCFSVNPSFISLTVFSVYICISISSIVYNIFYNIRTHQNEHWTTTHWIRKMTCLKYTKRFISVMKYNIDRRLQQIIRHIQRQKKRVIPT